MAARKTLAQWERIEREYCAGEDSIREIADRNEISEAAIRKRAKTEKWARAVRRREPLRTLPVIAAPTPRQAPAEPVEAGAIAEQGRQLIARMFDELDTVTSQRGELEQLVEIACEDDEDRADVFAKVLSLPARSAIAKNLASALKTLNETSAPQGKKAAQQQRASAIGAKFGTIAAPGGKSIQ